MIILGVNAYHGDSSACLVKDGNLIAAAEEERFRRIKHWAGFPSEAIRWCLKEANVDLQEIDYLTVNRDPKANLYKKILFTISKRPSFNLVRDRLTNALKVKDVKIVMSEAFGVPKEKIGAKLCKVEHHRAHMASSFFVSPFRKAAILSVDGFGDFTSTMTGEGEKNRIKVIDQVNFPHSLGLFYTAFTQFLGFPRYGDEYKMMGLAAYGRPKFLREMEEIVVLKDNGKFELNLDYFIHHSKGVTMLWDGGYPEMGRVYSDKLIEKFGSPRKPQDKITDFHQDIAASVQAMYEKAFFHILNHLYKVTKISNLCLAGGCALNSVANGKIFDNTPFKEIYIQPASSDAGGALGAAFYLWHQILGKPRNFIMKHTYWGPRFSKAEVHETLNKRKMDLEKVGCQTEEIIDKAKLCQEIAQEIADGKIVGWFQGKMEWGPRALGNRSILCDPRRKEMKDILNTRIKKREPFRPFAPSILLERVGDYFEKDYPDPFMIKVYPIRKNKREVIPAVTHVDGTGRLQTVSRKENSLYWTLIKEFEKITGVPVILNTSFNENEPIVCTPEEALDCFLRTKMDILILESFVIRKRK